VTWDSPSLRANPKDQSPSLVVAIDNEERAQNEHPSVYTAKEPASVDFGTHNRVRILLLPGVIILAAAAVLIQTGLLKGYGSAVDSVFYYATFAIGLLLARRFHSSRVFSALILLLLAQRAVEFFSENRPPMPGPGLKALEAVSFLIPLNFALLALARERGFTFAAAVPRLALLFFESVFVAVICRPEPLAGPGLFHGALLNRGWFRWTEIPQISLLMFVVVFTGLLVHAFTHRKPLESGFVWALLSFFLALNMGAVGARAYVATAAVILAVSIVETSYAMAYHDELTGLQSRRAFQAPYTLAAVDIDHFKSVNDTYGHDIGDEVLSLVAAKLAHVTGGGQAYRVGGEEFSILFPGKSVAEVMPDLENLRVEIERSGFRLRGRDRRTIPRGADRRATAQKKSSRRKANLSTPPGYLRVTVSIGVAEPTAKKPTFEEVMDLADQALYRAKDAGRNRVEVAATTRTRGKKKAAGNTA
jgi:GGDEF domain-containing protein